MIPTDRAANASGTPGVGDCWNRIGVSGDRTCPDLVRHIHCRNCPVYSEAAVAFLNRAASVENIDDRTAHFARPEVAAARRTQSAIVFRVGADRFAVRTSLLVEVGEPRKIHSLPHPKSGVVLGLVNVGGELLVCASLPHLLGIDAAASVQTEKVAQQRRVIVLRHEERRMVLPVDEVAGVHRFDPEELRPLPASVTKLATSVARTVLPFEGGSAAFLDEALLFAAVGRALA